MFLMMMLVACKSVYYHPSSRVTGIATGGSDGEFFIASDVMCGTRYLTSRITRCKYISSTNDTVCYNVADTESLDANIGKKGTEKFKVSASDIVCIRKEVDIDMGESGWSPNQEYNE